MQAKITRQRAILEIVALGQVATQAELKLRLKERGIAVDQATLSRDAKELDLVKVGDPAGGYRYATVEQVSHAAGGKASVVLARLVRGADCSGNLVVVRTSVGDAQPVALAIDHLGWPEVVGTLAGDDTIIIVVREGVAARKVVKKVLGFSHGKKDAA
jgi:transcriptional regulator of arginine metabolism